MDSKHHLLPAARLLVFSEGEVWGIWRGVEELRLVGWVVLMLCFVLAFKDMEMEHPVVIGMNWFKDRELINNFKFQAFVN